MLLLLGLLAAMAPGAVTQVIPPSLPSALAKQGEGAAGAVDAFALGDVWVRARDADADRSARPRAPPRIHTLLPTSALEPVGAGEPWGGERARRGREPT